MKAIQCFLLVIISFLSTPTITLVTTAAIPSKNKGNSKALIPPTTLTQGPSLEEKQLKQLKDLNMTRWGSTILSFAQLQLQLGGPITKLVASLEKLVKDLRARVDSENTRFDQKQAIHEARLQEIQVKINEISSDIATNRQKVENKLKPHKRAAEDQIASLKKRMAGKLEEVASLKHNRELEIQSHKRKMEEINHAIKAVDTCSTSLEEMLKDSTALVQIKIDKSRKRLSDLHEHMVNSHLVERPVLESLISMVNSQEFGRADIIRGVMKMLESLRQQLSTASQREAASDDSLDQMFTDRMETMKGEIENAKNAINSNAQLVGDDETDIDQITESIAKKMEELVTQKQVEKDEQETWRQEGVIHERLEKDTLTQIEQIKGVQEVFGQKEFVGYLAKKIQ